jgi:hypothetical protein
MAHLDPSWAQHTFGGSLNGSLIYYAGSLVGTHSRGFLVFGGLFIGVFLCALSFFFGRQEASGPDRRRMRASGYLGAILLANLVLVAKAQHPSDFYLYLGAWAFYGGIAAAFASLRPKAGWDRWLLAVPKLGLVAVFVAARASAMSGPTGDLARIHTAHLILAGYERIVPYCPQAAQTGLKLSFSAIPLGQWYYFRGIDEKPDQLVGAFICGRTPPFFMSYDFSGGDQPDRPGEVVVTWDAMVRLVRVVAP